MGDHGKKKGVTDVRGEDEVMKGVCTEMRLQIYVDML